MNQDLERIKVLHLISGLGVGGAEMMLYKLVSSEPDGLVENVVISMLDTGPVGQMIERAGIPVYALDMTRGRASGGALMRLVRLLRALRPDVVQTWMYHANLLGLLGNGFAGRAPVVWGLRHSSLDPERNKASTLRIARLSARLSRFTSAVVCCSEKTYEVHRAIGYAEEKLVMIPNGFDTHVFQPDAAARHAIRSELEIPNDVPLFGMIGRYDPLKDHSNFLRAAGRLSAEHPEARFVLCGLGLTWETEQLVREIRSAGLEERIYLLGQRNDIPAVMNALDIHVLSSAGEGFPNVLGEAMACGVPCITTNVGDAALIVGETGWVVPPNDSDGLACAMSDFLAIGADRFSDMKIQARNRIIDHFSVHVITGLYHDLYKQILGRD